MAAWTDPSRLLDERAEALLAVLTLEEKVAQLGSVWPKGPLAPVDPADVVGGTRIPFENAPPVPGDLYATATLDDRTALGLGHLARAYGGWPQTVPQAVDNLRAWHRHVVDSSPHRIPPLVHEESLTGLTAYGATVYPTGLAWGATFDPDLVREMGDAIGDDLARSGVDQTLAPLLDVVRDYRYGRCEETSGEDPYLVATLGTAYVTGVQAHGVLATLKHFAGYAASRAGRNHAAVSLGRRELEDQVLPPFEMAVREGGAESVMNSYAAVDGVPVAASHELLTGVLRNRWGFEGTVVGDYNAVVNLVVDNAVAHDLREAGIRALTAGLDVELPDTMAYLHLVDAVRTGELDEAVVDTAVRRVLRHKVRRGLLDETYDPDALGDPALNLDSARNRDIARRMAEESIVLLANDGVLPLALGGRVALVGPTAEDARCLMGCYAFPNHVMPGFVGADDPIGIPVTTIREALDGRVDVSYAPGVGIRGSGLSDIVSDESAATAFMANLGLVDPGPDGIAEAVRVAGLADVVVCCVGDRSGMFGWGTSGEGCDVEHLALPNRQHDLVEAMLATGTPVVLVVVSGRPYALGAYESRAAAMVQAFFPGSEGGPAVARVLTGEVNPSGHLPVQIPRTPWQTTTYLGGPLEHRHFASTVDPTPLYGFGHGLSYTTFEVSDLTLSDTEVPTDGSLAVSVTVANGGDRDGATVVQLYLTDVAAQVEQPLRRLVGYARVGLAAGERRRVTFELHTDRMSFTGLAYDRIVEPGAMVLSAGLAETDLPLAAPFTLTGRARVVPEGRVLTTPVHIH